MRCLNLLVAAACIAVSSANMYDLFFPKYISTCKGGCASWSEVGNATLFTNNTIPANALNYCAMPSQTAGFQKKDISLGSDPIVVDSYSGPWCYCNPTDDTSTYTPQYCEPAHFYPEQINLQIASPTSVVAAFVTYENTTSPSAPVAMFGTSESNMTEITGITHIYKPPGRTYYLHYVRFANLTPRGTYFYKVRSGASAWSDTFSFKAPEPLSSTGKETRIATYGDMGHSRYNNVENMLEDCLSGEIFAIVHMGDHCYNMGDVNDTRGDAYMNTLQPLLTQCPWYPIIGNHEHADGDNFNRYLNLTYGEIYGNQKSVKTTADSALGHFLTKASLYGAGWAEPTPSNTSRYVSSNIGLLHVVALDLNNLDPDQVAWLKADLAAANKNRDQVPWIMVASHFPLYHSMVYENLDMSAKHYIGDESEEYATEGHEFQSCSEDGCRTVGEFLKDLTDILDPILMEFGVDLYNAGHVHDYDVTWPVHNSTVCQKSYVNPKCPVHLTEGNGGVPGVVGVSKMTTCSSDWCRAHGTGGNYGRIHIYNSTTLTYTHVANNGGAVLDTFTIVQDNHGPFSGSA